MATLLSDEELRRKLLEHGVDVGPITHTTRTIYEKKLRDLESRRKSNRRSLPQKAMPTRSLLTFSSDESESEGAGGSSSHGGGGGDGSSSKTNSARKLRHRRRQTIQFPNNESSPSRGVLTRTKGDQLGNETGGANKLIPNYNSSSTSHKPFSTGSPSGSPSTFRTSNQPQHQHHHPHQPNIQNSVNLTPRRALVAPPPHHFDSSGTDSDITDGLSDSYSSGNRKLGNNAAVGVVGNKGVISASGDLNDSLSSSLGLRTRYNPTSSLENTIHNTVSRLYDNHSPLTTTTTTSWLGRKDIIHSASNGSGETLLNSQFRITENLSSSGNSHCNSHCISMVLLAFAVLFFLTLGVLYLSVRNKDSRELQQTQIPSHGQPCSHSETCSMGQIDTTAILNVLNLLRSKLRQIAGLYECGLAEKATDRKLSLDEAKHLLVENGLLKTTRSAMVSDCDTGTCLEQGQAYNNNENSTLALCLRVFLKNPAFGIRLYAKNYTVLTFDTDWQEVHWLDSIHSEKPFFCRLKQAFNLVLYKLLFAAAVLIALLVSGLVAYWQWRLKKIRHKEVIAMTENILNFLQQNYEARLSNPDLPECVPIPHVRDNLIPLPERKQKQPIWDLAVKFLEEHESRVRVEYENIQGEDYKVWRWLHNPAPRETPKKLWQGQAFENLDSGLNAMPYSPTACLKIRNMFDPDVEYGDSWHDQIQDAILEKCEGINGIVHVKVDTSSREGCVYVKCCSPEVAGQVYRALHGWWFDGSLVTVRYLRLERYHERFPEAANAKTPLKPSNNKRLSLGLPTFKSFLEH